MIKNEDMQTVDWNKFTVIKNSDIERYLGIEEEFLIKKFTSEIEYSREMNGEDTDRKYIVVNIDEPYAQDVLDILKVNGHWG